MKALTDCLDQTEFRRIVLDMNFLKTRQVDSRGARAAEMKSKQSTNDGGVKRAGDFNYQDVTGNPRSWLLVQKGNAERTKSQAGPMDTEYHYKY